MSQSCWDAMVILGQDALTHEPTEEPTKVHVLKGKWRHRDQRKGEFQKVTLGTVL